MIRLTGPVTSRRVASDIANIIRSEWVRLVKDDRDFKRSSNYIRGLKQSVTWKSESDFSIEVINTYPNADRIEHGSKAFHLPSVIKHWGTNKKGFKFTIIRMPIRRGMLEQYYGKGYLSKFRAAARKEVRLRTPLSYYQPTRSFSQLWGWYKYNKLIEPPEMSKSYKMYRKLGMKKTPRMGGTYNKTNQFGDEIQYTVDDNRFVDSYTWRTSLFSNYQFESASESESGKSEIYTFRTVKQQTKGFYIPSKKGKFFAKRAEDAAKPKIEAYFREVANQQKRKNEEKLQSEVRDLFEYYLGSGIVPVEGGTISSMMQHYHPQPKVRGKYRK